LECNQLNPARGLAYHQAKIDKLNALASKKALLSVNLGVADTIVLDSGTTGHYLKRRKYFITYRPIDSSVFGANGATIPILGTGTAVIHALTGPIFIQEAFYVPDLLNSLLSLCLIVRMGYTISPSRNGNGFQCRRGDHTLCVSSTSKLVLVIELNNLKALAVKSNCQNALDLHRSLGHPSLPYLKRAFPDFSCAACDTSKMHRQPYSGSFPSATKTLECIHMDLCGPITPTSCGGNLYFLKIINGFSKYRFIFPMKKKSDTFSLFSEFLSHAKTFTGNKLISVVSDNGRQRVCQQPVQNTLCLQGHPTSHHGPLLPTTKSFC
jgi:hypothetical protein